MWFVFGLVTLLAAGVFSYLHRRADRWKGEMQPGGWLLQIGRNAKTKQMLSAVIGVPFECAFDFECKPETAFDRFFKRHGLARELEVGHKPFDDDVYLICDDARLRALLRTNLVLVENLHLLVSVRHPRFTFNKLVCRGGTLRATFKASGDDIDPLMNDALPALQAVASALPPATAFTAKDRDPLLLRSVLVLAASTSLAINGALQILRLVLNDDTIIVDRGAMWTYGLLAGGALLVVLVGFAMKMLAGTSRLQIVLVEVLLVGTFGCFASGVSLVRDANTALDFSAAQPQRAMVGFMETRVSRSRRGRSTSYYVTYHGADLPNDGEIRVSHSQYLRMRTAMPVVVNYHDGALGIRWVSSIDPAPYEFDLTPE